MAAGSAYFLAEAHQAVADLLGAAYGHAAFSLNDPDVAAAQCAAALQSVGDVLRELNSLGLPEDVMPTLTLPQVSPLAMRARR